MKTKKEIRQEIKIIKKLLSQKEKLEAEKTVLKQLLNDATFLSNQNIAAYWSLDDELPTKHIIEILSHNHNIYLPVITEDKIDFYKYTGEQKLKTESHYGICEPQKTNTKLDITKSVSIIIPGVAFTKDGIRLGRGGGYYDKILKKIKNSYKVGVAFKCQIIDDIPSEPFDVKMDKIYFG